MVLADTSVWIRFLANQAPYAAGMDRLLRLDEVAGYELINGELLIGDRGGRARLSTFVRDRDLQGRGLGWIDVHLLASALVGRFRLWTADSRFSAIANEFGVGYEG